MTSEMSQTLGCSIEISRDIYNVCLILSMGKQYKKIVCYNAWVDLRRPNTRMLKNLFWEFETKYRF